MRHRDDELDPARAAPPVVPPALALPALTPRRELARKAIHLASAVVPVAYALGLPRARLLAGLLLLLAAALVVELARHRLPAARRLFTRATGALLRAHEHRALSGATWMLVSYVLVTWLAPRPAAIAAMWAVAVGDAAAAIVGRAVGGRWFPARRSARTGKSLEGSLACLVATAAGAALVARLGPAACVAAGIAATLAERPSRPGDDNVRVATATALAVVLVHAMLGVV